MSESLHDRWERMDAEELRAELFRFFRAQGLMQATLYEKIERLEKRIGQQRKELLAASDERAKLVSRIQELEQLTADQ